MSDYGAGITIKRNDNARLSPDDKERIRGALDETQAATEWTDCLGRDFLFIADDAREGGRQVYLRLSEYVYGQPHDEEKFTRAKDADLHQAQKLAERLQNWLGEGFGAEAEFGER